MSIASRTSSKFQFGERLPRWSVVRSRPVRWQTPTRARSMQLRTSTERGCRKDDSSDLYGFPCMSHPTLQGQKLAQGTPLHQIPDSSRATKIENLSTWPAIKRHCNSTTTKVFPRLALVPQNHKSAQLSGATRTFLHKLLGSSSISPVPKPLSPALPRMNGERELDCLQSRERKWT